MMAAEPVFLLGIFANKERLLFHKTFKDDTSTSY